MKKLIQQFSKVFVGISAFVMALVARPVGAVENGLFASIKDNLDTAAGEGAGLSYMEPADIVAMIVRGVLGVLVVVFFVLIFVAGVQWMTAAGKEETIAKAKKIISNSVVGLVVVMLAYAITILVFDVLLGTNTATGG